MTYSFNDDLLINQSKCPLMMESLSSTELYLRIKVVHLFRKFWNTEILVLQHSQLSNLFSIMTLLSLYNNFKFNNLESSNFFKTKLLNLPAVLQLLEKNFWCPVSKKIKIVLRLHKGFAKFGKSKVISRRKIFSTLKFLVTAIVNIHSQ